MEEHSAADRVEPATEQLAKLDSLPPAAGRGQIEEARRLIER
ncbi:hypothetical protein ACIRU3_41030 [Streptomyces sp. NPDC101151]